MNLCADQEGVNSYHNLHQKTGLPDYSFLKHDQAKRFVGVDLYEYDHLGEVCDIPSWNPEDLASAESGLREKINTDLKDDSSTLVFPPYADGASAPIDEGVDRFLLNAYAS